jgi:hypothetical protein
VSFLRRGREGQRQVPAVPPEPAGSYSERYRGTEWGQPADPSVWGQSGQPEAPAAAEPDPAPAPEPVPSIPPPPAEPGRSFSERYRDTEFAGAVQAAGGKKPRKRRGIVTTVLTLGSALLAMGAVAFIGMTVLQGGGLPSIPGLPDGSPVASSSPVPPTASPGSVTKAAVINAFIKRVTAKNLGYHVEFSAAFTATAYDNTEVATMAGTIDIRGLDFSGIWRVHIYDGRNAETSIVYLGKTGYVRPPEESWQCVAPRTPRPQVNAFSAFKTAKDVRYEGIVTKDGQRLHRLRAVKPLQANPWVLQDDWAKSPISDVAYDVLVTDQGLPISGTFTARMRVPDGVSRTEIRIATDYRYTNVGRPPQIKAPAGVCKNQTPS